MARQRYYLDTRVLTAYFFAAMPFVAFGSFIVVNQAKNQLRESVGTSLEQRAVQTKLALEQYVAEQVVQLRLLALDAEVQKVLAAPPGPVPEADVRGLEQAWAAGRIMSRASSSVCLAVSTTSPGRAARTTPPSGSSTSIVDAHSFQVQTCLLVTGRKWWDLLSYHPTFPKVVERVLPDPTWREAVEPAIEDFLRDLDAAVATIRAKGGASCNPLA